MGTQFANVLHQLLGKKNWAPAMPRQRLFCVVIYVHQKKQSLGGMNAKGASAPSLCAVIYVDMYMYYYT